MSRKRKVGRPAKPQTEAQRSVALQGTLLAEAVKAGIPVSQEVLTIAAQALAKFSPSDLTILEPVAKSPLALEALASLAVADPDAFLKHYTSLMEFTRPRLARTEVKHEGLEGSIFIAVEQREAGPPPKLAGRVLEHGA